MKNNFKKIISRVIVAVFILCFVLMAIFSSLGFDNAVWAMAVVIIVLIVLLCAGSFIASIIYIVRISRSTARKVDEENLQYSDDIADIHNINNSYGIESKIAAGEFQVKQNVKAWRSSNRREKFFGTLFGIFIIALLVAAVVSLFINIKLFFIFLAAFMLTILIAFISSKIKESIILGCVKKTDGCPTIDGIVKSCFASSSIMASGRNVCSSARIINVTFKVKVEIATNIITTYSKVPYVKGQMVKVCKVGRYYVIKPEINEGESDKIA